MLEDVGLRLGEAANYLSQAVQLLKQALAKGVDKADDVQDQIDDLTQLAKSLRGTSLHFLETIAAYDVRVTLKQENAEKFQDATQRLEQLLLMDLENQDQDEDMQAVYEAFKNDPATWVRVNLQQPYKYNNPVRLGTFDQKM